MYKKILKMRLRGNFYFRGCYSKPPQAEKKIHKKNSSSIFKGNPFTFFSKKKKSTLKFCLKFTGIFFVKLKKKNSKGISLEKFIPALVLHVLYFKGNFFYNQKGRRSMGG